MGLGGFHQLQNSLQLAFFHFLKFTANPAWLSWCSFSRESVPITRSLVVPSSRAIPACSAPAFPPLGDFHTRRRLNHSCREEETRGNPCVWVLPGARQGRAQKTDILNFRCCTRLMIPQHRYHGGCKKQQPRALMNSQD